MTTKSMWGYIDTKPEKRMPVTILKEQAEYIREITEEWLEGRISQINYGNNRVHYSLNIVAPSLGYYSYTVLGMDCYPPSLYPIFIEYYKKDSDENFQCENEKDVNTVLEGILSSGEVKDVIESLIAQSKQSEDSVVNGVHCDDPDEPRGVDDF